MSYDRSAGDAAAHSCSFEGCAESRLLMSRRSMLGMSAGLFSWAFMPRFAEAASAGFDPRLVVAILRGGMDGLTAVVPFGDPSYKEARGNLAIPTASTIRLNSFFGLHPALQNFAGFYNDGDAAVVHAVSVPLRTRSHFDAQDNLETGMPGPSVGSSGWLNRLLTALPAGTPIRANGAVEIGRAPLILRGPAPVLGWSPGEFKSLNDPIRYMIRTLYRSNDPELLRILDRGLTTHQMALGLGIDDGDLSVLQKGFRGAGRLIAAPDGPRIAVLSVDGWDSHSDQGDTDGMLAKALAQLDLGLQEFKTAAAPVWGQTMLLIVTEFGRTVRVNGDAGTDHGTGTVALLAGGAVNGRRVITDWPGLATQNLLEGRDLKPTADLRAVFKGALLDHLGVPETIINSEIFPDSSGVRPLRDLVKSSSSAALHVPGSSLAQSFEGFERDSAIARFRRALATAAAA